MLKKSNDNNCVKRPISVGIVPINVLLEKNNLTNCVKRPISLGIVEVKALLERSKNVNCVKRPISVGIMVEPVLSSPHKLSNDNVDWQVVKSGMVRNSQAICLGSAVGGAAVGFAVGFAVGTAVGFAVGAFFVFFGTFFFFFVVGFFFFFVFFTLRLRSGPSTNSSAAARGLEMAPLGKARRGLTVRLRMARKKIVSVIVCWWWLSNSRLCVEEESDIASKSEITL